MFIQLNEKNEIMASADFKFSEDAIETDKEVVRNWDGRLVFKGEETEKPEPSLEELKKEKFEELKKERDIYKSKTFIREGYSLLDFEPFSCYNYHNLIRLKCGWKQEDLDKFDVENEFISKFWDTKKAEINNATTKTKLKNINVVFKKEEKKE